MGTISERPRRWRIFDKITDKAMHFMIAAGLWIVFSGIGLLLSGFRSKSVIYWIIAIIVFPFLYALGEGIVELFRKLPSVAKIGQLSKKKQKKRHSLG